MAVKTVAEPLSQLRQLNSNIGVGWGCTHATVAAVLSLLFAVWKRGTACQAHPLQSMGTRSNHETSTWLAVVVQYFITKSLLGLKKKKTVRKWQSCFLDIW